MLLARLLLLVFLMAVTNLVRMLKMFKDSGMMEHLICPVCGLDCKLTDSPLFIRYKKLSSSQIYFWPGNTWYIYRVYWGSI